MITATAPTEFISKIGASMYPMGETYYALTFGVGGDQTTFDTSTSTTSLNKDWLLIQLADRNSLNPAWNQFIASAHNSAGDTKTTGAFSSVFGVILILLVVVYLFFMRR